GSITGGRGSSELISKVEVQLGFLKLGMGTKQIKFTWEARGEAAREEDRSCTSQSFLLISVHSCTAGGDDHETAGHTEDEKQGDEKKIKFKNKIEKLRQLKQEMEELEKKYDSYFTPEYATKLTENEFKDSDDDFVDSSESERSGLEISEDELLLDDNEKNKEEEDVDSDDEEEDEEDDEDEDDFDEENDYDER
ncbi:hypothetical protein L7F22_055399, partial [Adiantum nelumboides]|nr:hypothetical protein [Adiantum nelumboides]